jgi:hypothetical protein
VKRRAFGSTNLGGFAEEFAGTIEVAVFDGNEGGVVDRPRNTAWLTGVPR